MGNYEIGWVGDITSDSSTLKLQANHLEYIQVEVEELKNQAQQQSLTELCPKQTAEECKLIHKQVGGSSNGCTCKSTYKQQGGNTLLSPWAGIIEIQNLKLVQEHSLAAKEGLEKTYTGMFNYAYISACQTHRTDTTTRKHLNNDFQSRKSYTS